MTLALQVDSTPQVSSGAIPAKTLAIELATYFRKYAHLKADSIYLLLALWVIGTYLVDGFDFYGYLFLHSGQPRCGKTRVLQLLDMLVANSTGIQTEMTKAGFFRTATGKTQLFDELDSLLQIADFKALLNVGFQRGGKVSRQRATRDGDYETVVFNVYGAKAMAAIKLKTLAPATLDRVFAIRMERRDEPGPRFSPRYEAEVTRDMKARIEVWASQNREGIAARLNTQGDLPFPWLGGFSDRTVDIAEPLAAILEQMYDSREDYKEVVETLCEAIALTRSEKAIEQKQLLERLVDCANAEGQIVGMASELAARIGMPPREITTTLRAHGFTTISVRTDEDVRNRYRMTRSDLERILNRYFRTL